VVATVVPVMAAAWARMSTAMRNAPLRRLVIVLGPVLVVFAAFAVGMGAYAAVLALWPWLLAGAVAVVAVGAWWLWWRLPKAAGASTRFCRPEREGSRGR